MTRHSIRIDGKTVSYSSTVGWLIMTDDDEKPIARFGYTAYTLDGIEDVSRRPIMFAFNGGPGSSSIWLHMGVLGPRRVVVTDEGFTPPPPSERVDNAFSIIDATDLVMVDPVGTGFSKPLGEAKGEDFWGVDQDIRSVGAFIKKYVSRNGRWGYYDLATPSLATKHDVAHLDIAPEARERIRMEYYEAGHMMYLHEPSMQKFRNDLVSFIRDTDRL